MKWLNSVHTALVHRVSKKLKKLVQNRLIPSVPLSPLLWYLLSEVGDSLKTMNSQIWKAATNNLLPMPSFMLLSERRRLRVRNPPCQMNVLDWKSRQPLHYLALLISTGGRRKRKKPTVQDEYRKLNFPRKIQAIKLDKSSATKLL